MFITIFTPTYNRLYTLQRLYKSLCNQTDKDFEWVVVDDGSTDNTHNYIDECKKEKKIIIRYFYQKNSGKPAAHNLGTQEAKGKLFVCVDSDDFLEEKSIETIKAFWKKNESSKYIGILAAKRDISGKWLTIFKKEINESTLKEAYNKRIITGDTMLIYRTELIKQYRFPIINHEKFIPEGYIYNKLDQKGKLLFLKKPIYICEYQKDGYTNNINKIIFNNYKSYILHINERLKQATTRKEKLLDSIRYDAIMIAHKENNILKNAIYPFYSILGYLPGYILYLIKYKNIKQ